MTRATLLLRYKRTDMDGDIIEQVAWKVPVSILQPEGVRYRFAFVRHGERIPAVLYDNHHPKGHHKHLGKIEYPIQFTGLPHLRESFERDVAAHKSRSRGTK